MTLDLGLLPACWKRFRWYMGCLQTQGTRRPLPPPRLTVWCVSYAVHRAVSARRAQGRRELLRQRKRLSLPELASSERSPWAPDDEVCVSIVDSRNGMGGLPCFLRSRTICRATKIVFFYSVVYCLLLMLLLPLLLLLSQALCGSYRGAWGGGVSFFSVAQGRGTLFSWLRIFRGNGVVEF